MKKTFNRFFTNFQIIGLTIASIIGLAVSSLSKTFTEEIINAYFEPYFSHNLKNLQ